MHNRVFAIACIGTMLAWTAESPAQNAKPEYGRWGFDLAGADISAKPGDSFFRYANGAWLDKTEIPADKSAYSLDAVAIDRIEQRLHDLMEAAVAQVRREPGTPEGKVGVFYKSFMDATRIETLGAGAIAPQLDALRKARNHDELAALMGRCNTDFESSLFSMGIDVDLKDPTRYVVYVSQAGLGLPDRDYYLKPDFAKQKTAYEHHAKTLLELIGWKRPQQAASNIVAFEEKIAEVSWTKTQQRDPNASYNPMAPAELEKLAPGFAWGGFFREAQLNGLARIIVAEKSAFPKLAAIYAKTPVETLTAWHAFHIADNAAYYLSKPFADAYFEMHDKALSGQREQRARWKRGVHAVSGGNYATGARSDAFGNLGWAVGELYVARYFPPESKARIEELVANLKAAYRVRIEKLDWMTDQTKAEALRKLDTYTIKVGYPDHLRDYSKVVVRDDDLIGNVLHAANADWSFFVARLNGPVDRSDWGMTPQTYDAYNGSLRDIVFPAGFLQPPMFDANADSAINFGAIGATIGHELTHGFDDEGRKIDADGALRDWWTAEDAKVFETRAKMLGAQYSAFEPLPGVRIDGELTMGENIADLGGLILAFDAYRASLQGKPAPVIDGYNGDQRVFLGYAQSWRGKAQDDEVRRQLTSNVHSQRRFRVDGVVRNIDAWYDLFDVEPGQKLYIARSERVRIW